MWLNNVRAFDNSHLSDPLPIQIHIVSYMKIIYFLIRKIDAYNDSARHKTQLMDVVGVFK